jgi:heme-degrading monooxygenase HmoA
VTIEDKHLTEGGDDQMPKLVEKDENTTFFAQMDQEIGPVILINEFTVAPEDTEQFLKAWAGDAGIMKQQPGFISTQLHRGIGKSRVFVNYALWESAADFRRAFNNPEFQSRVRDYPPSVVATPHLFQKVAVPRVCVR